MIDLLLRTFDLPWRDEWSGSRQAYVIAMIQQAQDEQLLALANHLRINDSAINPQVEADCWKPGYFRVFLTHVSAHKEFAADLQLALLKHAIYAFVAHVDIEPTREWQDEIEKALLTSDVLVALMTPDFHASNWTDQEIGICRGRGIPIMPVRMGLDPYGFIGKYQALQGFQKAPEQIANEIFEILIKKEPLKKRMAQAVVNMFADSKSFRRAKENLGLVWRIEHLLDDDLLNQLNEAVKNNGQVNGSFGVPDSIRHLNNKVKGIKV